MLTCSVAKYCDVHKIDGILKFYKGEYVMLYFDKKTHKHDFDFLDCVCGCRGKEINDLNKLNVTEKFMECTDSHTVRRVPNCLNIDEGIYQIYEYKASFITLHKLETAGFPNMDNIIDNIKKEVEIEKEDSLNILIGNIIKTLPETDFLNIDEFFNKQFKFILPWFDKIYITEYITGPERPIFFSNEDETIIQLSMPIVVD